MPNVVVALVIAALQPSPTGTGLSSPPNGDTTGYWQQTVHYTITATLDEPGRRVRARATLSYANNSPDTLREMYFHQYLNAFRPGSRWSAVDAREGRERFQRLDDPDYGYERFTAPILVNGAPVAPSYPGAPDSTVARITLPSPLLPGDTALIAFEWDARPSTIPRRQARRGRHWDLAQWYPKVAVYDRGGWQHNALQPAGEFYGEFGTYDVTLLVRDDQVLAAPGVPVSGDPGWAGVSRGVGGTLRPAADAYGPDTVAGRAVDAPVGHKAVRFVARDIHHFAWSASPDFRYEGGVYVRPLPPTRFRAWDSVSVHVLYRPGDDSTWGGQRVVDRTIAAIRWLELIYGPYAYPQMTVFHRIDGGGTEFPMMQANGSPSQGLILHEGGHIWTYGVLANNEWRSAWLDEGLTSYQTAWAQALTPYERYRAGIVDRFAPVTGYRAKAIRMRLPRFEALALGQTMTDLEGGAEPMGTTAHEFRDFGTYNDMVYSRAEVMYGQLRDVLGDSLFVVFLRDYYARWALKHVDERAMRAAAERASGRDLGWFFEQWVHRTGVMDYALGETRTIRDAAGAWITEAAVRRRGEYRHPMTVGVRTPGGWTFGRMTGFPYDGETVRIRTAEAPLEVRLDPLHLSWDWDRRNDARRSGNPFTGFGARLGLDWPFLDQADRERYVVLFAPLAWYSDAGGIAAGVRKRGNYLGIVDLSEAGMVYSPDPRVPDIQPANRLHFWYRVENPYLPWASRPAMGWRGSAAHLDGLVRAEIGRKRTYTRGITTVTSDVSVAYADVVERQLAPELWGNEALDVSARVRRQQAVPQRGYWYLEAGGLAGTGGRGGAAGPYTKGDAALGAVREGEGEGERVRTAIRLFGAVSSTVPAQRAILASAQDPMATFWNHWWRPAGALLMRPGFNWLPLGGAGMRGYQYGLASRTIGAANLDLGWRIGNLPGSNSLGLWAHAFGDGAYSDVFETLGDAGVGAAIRGRLYDRDIIVRIDAPFYVSRPEHAIGGGGAKPLAPRWVITFNDLW